MIQILRWVKNNTDDIKYIGIHDDEYYINIDSLDKIIEEGNKHQYFISGYYLWKKAEYQSQKKFNGSFSPYFSGWCVIYNKELINEILNDTNISYTGSIMGNAEDLQTGEWINRVIKKTGKKVFMYESNDILNNI